MKTMLRANFVAGILNAGITQPMCWNTTDVLEQACGDAEKAWGKDAEVYRCEHCKTLYLPHPEAVRGLNVAGQGQTSIFGLTVAPKVK